MTECITITDKMALDQLTPQMLQTRFFYTPCDFNGTLQKITPILATLQEEYPQGYIPELAIALVKRVLEYDKLDEHPQKRVRKFFEWYAWVNLSLAIPDIPSKDIHQAWRKAIAAIGIFFIYHDSNHDLDKLAELLKKAMQKRPAHHSSTYGVKHKTLLNNWQQSQTRKKHPIFEPSWEKANGFFSAVTIFFEDGRELRCESQHPAPTAKDAQHYAASEMWKKLRIEGYAD